MITKIQDKFEQIPELLQEKYTVNYLAHKTIKLLNYTFTIFINN